MVKIFSAIFMCFALLSPVYGDNTQDLLSGLIDKYTGLPAVQNKSKDIIEAQTKNISPIVQNYLQILQDQADQGVSLSTSAQLPPNSRIESLSYDPSSKVVTLILNENNHAFIRNQKIALKPLEDSTQIYFNSLSCQTSITNFVDKGSKKSTIIRSIFDYGDNCTVIENPEDFSQSTDQERFVSVAIKDNRAAIAKQQLKGISHYVSKLANALESYDAQYNMNQNKPYNNEFGLTSSGFIQTASHDRDGNIFIQLKSSGMHKGLRSGIVKLSPRYENGSYNYTALSCTTNIKNIYTPSNNGAIVHKVSDASIGLGPCYYNSSLSMP